MFSVEDATKKPVDELNTAVHPGVWAMFSVEDASKKPVDEWNTAVVPGMGAMFSVEDASKKPVDNNWNTAAVTNMTGMFALTLRALLMCLLLAMPAGGVGGGFALDAC